MKSKSIKISLIGLVCLIVTACCTPSAKPVETEKNISWKDELKNEIPLLGHRNWIVVADMAYPLQSKAGIRTIYVDEPYTDILKFVYDEIAKAPHIKAHIYQDLEFSFLAEKDAPGIDALRGKMRELSDFKALPVLHDELIARLDEISRMFNVIIIKSSLTIPYTTTFFELDCDYWTADKEQALRDKISAGIK